MEAFDGVRLYPPASNCRVAKVWSGRCDVGDVCSSFVATGLSVVIHSPSLQTLNLRRSLRDQRESETSSQLHSGPVPGGYTSPLRLDHSIAPALHHLRESSHGLHIRYFPTPTSLLLDTAFNVTACYILGIEFDLLSLSLTTTRLDRLPHDPSQPLKYRRHDATAFTTGSLAILVQEFRPISRRWRRTSNTASWSIVDEPRRRAFRTIAS